MRAYLSLLLLLSATACNCGQVVVRSLAECERDPTATGCQAILLDAGWPPPVDAGHPKPPVDAGHTCDTGTVQGTICAPDLHTSVAGATVTVSGVCDGQSFTQTTTTNASGQFTITVPAGTWNLTATSGSFTQSFPITVTAGETTTNTMDQQYCFSATITKLAVITGAGDQIENLLTATGFTPTLIDGTTTGFAANALPFLLSPTQLAEYNVIFIDCGAGRTSITQADGGQSYDEFYLGPDSATIATNLQNFVKNGGSVYASDWAFIFIYLGWGTQFEWETSAGNTSPGSISFPFDPYDLMGFKNQTVTANVVDTGLAGYLGKNTVTISFPTTMNHWGLLSAVNSPATALITGSVQACTTGSCSNGAGASTAPLAALYRVTNGPGGAVAYTSFHNVNQAVPADIETILKYIVFKL